MFRSRLAPRLHGAYAMSVIRNRVAASLLLLVHLGLVGCTPQLIQLQPDGESMLPPATGQPLEVIASLAGGSDPMKVHCGRMVFGGLVGAASRTVAASTMPWAARHLAERAGGWQMLVELIRTEAEMQAGRLTVEIETRVTLRGAQGQIHLGQTRGYCKVSDVVADADGSRVVFQCLDRMARDLAGWLEGLNP